jgi:hypothetical protein
MRLSSIVDFRVAYVLPHKGETGIIILGEPSTRIDVVFGRTILVRLFDPIFIDNLNLCCAVVGQSRMMLFLE